jgi:hypothetical protein
VLAGAGQLSKNGRNARTDANEGGGNVVIVSASLEILQQFNFARCEMDIGGVANAKLFFKTSIFRQHSPDGADQFKAAN